MCTHVYGQICGLVRGVFVRELGASAPHFNILKLHLVMYN